MVCCQLEGWPGILSQYGYIEAYVPYSNICVHIHVCVSTHICVHRLDICLEGRELPQTLVLVPQAPPIWLFEK